MPMMPAFEVVIRPLSPSADGPVSFTASVAAPDVAEAIKVAQRGIDDYFGGDVQVKMDAPRQTGTFVAASPRLLGPMRRNYSNTGADRLDLR